MQSVSFSSGIKTLFPFGSFIFLIIAPARNPNYFWSLVSIKRNLSQILIFRINLVQSYYDRHGGVHFLLTGGTIDSYYDGTKDTVVPNEHSVIPEFINSLRLHTKNSFTEICMKDSRTINQEDRNEILKAIEESPFQKIIITHGTYTMPDTARFIKANLKRNDQVIMLIGSFIPIKGFSPSDGPFNLGYAVSQLEYLKLGIYVCMNGKTFNPEEVIKLLSEGTFSSIFNK